MSQVSCAIMEWSTGSFVGVSFKQPTFFRSYTKYLTALQEWKKFSAAQPEGHDLATQLQVSLLANARYVIFICIVSNFTNLYISGVSRL